MAFLGIGVGSIDVILNKTTFYPDEELEGSATLRLNEEVKARGFFAELVASKYDGNSTTILFSSKLTLDSERIYYPAETPKSYNFKFKIPVGIVSEIYYVGLIGSVMNFFQENNNRSISWFLKVKLDLPLSFDVSKSIQIFVNKRPQKAQN
ncbi:MAG: hypothetical protein QXX06_02960 [Candidatus Diapherotrites archaeon]